MKLTLFTAPWVTRVIPRALFINLFGRFTHLLTTKYCLPNPCPDNDYYFDSLAEALRQPAGLPDSLIQVLHDIECAAAALLDPQLSPDDPASNPENTESIRLRQAMELWLQQTPQLPPPVALQIQASPQPDSSPAPLPQLVTISEVRPNHQPALSETLPSAISTLHSDGQAFERLARLHPTEYDRVRRGEAKGLHLRVLTLDTEVARCRSRIGDEAEANAVTFPAIVPWPEPVQDAPELLHQVSGRFTNYLLLPDGAADAITLWNVHAHAFTAFHQTPRLNLYSPKRGCGKTTTLDVLATMVPRPFRTENMRAAVLFRVVDQQQPTLLLDEVDTYLPQADELRGLLNAGHKPGACAYRCEGAGNAIRAFKACAPAALAGIGALPATLQDRSILIPLVPAPAGQLCARFDEHHTDLEKSLAQKLARWAKDNFAALAACDPPLPPSAFNRLADNWRPLFAVAQVVGGDWPQRAADAFAKLTTEPSPAPDLGLILLSDIRLIFAQSGVNRLFSAVLVDSLRTQPNRSWSVGTHSTASPNSFPLSGPVQTATILLTEIWLARQLRPFGVYPHNVRIGDDRAKGYDLADFAEAFAHLLPSHPPNS